MENKPKILRTACENSVEFQVDADLVEFVSRFTWRCANISKNNYIITKIRGKTVYLHRLILCAQPGEIVDHVNQDTKDNRTSNLRIATYSENCANKKKLPNKTSKFKGVCFDKLRNKWMATANKDGQHFYLGRFEKEEDAAKAYDKRAKEFWGDFAVTNF